MFSTRSIMLLYIVFAVVTATAILVPTPIALVVSFAGIAVVFIITALNYREKKRKVESIKKKLYDLKSEGLFIDNRIIEGGDIFYNTATAILKDLERTIFKLVEKNIQLLSLKEIGRNIISSLDEKKLVESVFDYLMHGIGFKEVAFIIVRKNTRNLQGIINIEKNNKINKRVINFDIKQLEGAILNSLQTGKSFLIKDADLHPINEIGSKQLFPGSTMSSYVCVPLLKYSGKSKDRNPENCLLNKENGRDIDCESDLYLKDDLCLSCPQLPLLGALIVTDGYRATPLTNIDQVTVETVGSLVSSNIENWILYQELRQAEIFMEKVFESMSLGLFVTDLQGSITFMNRSAKLMAQTEIEMLKGTNIFEIIVDTDVDNSESLLRNTIQGEDSVSLHEGYLKRDDGYHIPIRIHTSKFFGEDNELQGAIFLVVDLSYIKKMEEEIRHLDRLAVLGRFTSAIAHEIRNPLTGIGAGVQYLKRSSDFSSDQINSVDSILSEVSRLDRIITDLFKVAKPRDILYQRVDISELIDRSYNSVKVLFDEKGVEFKKILGNKALHAEVDPDQIIQVLINLMRNAVEATGEGGEVTVKTRLYNEKVTDDKIREKENIIQIEIADNGVGIDSESVEKIFEPFFSKKSKGTGLGLFISHSIIQHHHGKIVVSSIEGKGSAFKVSLPVSKHGR